MKYFATRKDDAKTSETREFFIIENQTAEFAANNVNDDPANLDGRNTIHIIGIIIGCCLLNPVIDCQYFKYCFQCTNE